MTTTTMTFSGQAPADWLLTQQEQVLDPEVFEAGHPPHYPDPRTRVRTVTSLTGLGGAVLVVDWIGDEDSAYAGFLGELAAAAGLTPGSATLAPDADVVTYDVCLPGDDQHTTGVPCRLKVR